MVRVSDILLDTPHTTSLSNRPLVPIHRALSRSPSCPLSAEMEQRVAVIGGAGFLGSKLCQELLARGEVCGGRVTHLRVVDAVPPGDWFRTAADEANKAGVLVDSAVVDISDAAAIDGALPSDLTVVFHLAAVVSGHAEADLDAGMSVNLTGTLNVLQRCRSIATTTGRPPVLVFTSSVAVFGGELREPVDEMHVVSPQTSYGTQKAVCELLVQDFARRGIVDARAVRLPTVAVRPGAPNRAASSFVSGLVREPLAGKEAVIPVPASTKLWICSPRVAVANLIHAAEVSGHAWQGSRVLSLPGITVTVQELVDALREAAPDPNVTGLLRWQRDDVVERIVLGWACAIVTNRALGMGFRVDAAARDIVAAYIEDELGGRGRVGE